MSEAASPLTGSPAVRVPLGILAAAVVASLGNAAVAAITRAAGASHDFKPLHPSAYVFLTVVGVLAATAGWALVRRTPRALTTLRRLVPAVLVVSWVPDLLIGFGGGMAGASWTGVVGLMAMHVVVAAVVVAMLSRVLPVSDEEPGPAA